MDAGDLICVGLFNQSKSDATHVTGRQTGSSM